MKLFTIGDSISQGFMSFAAARTDLSYSSIIAAQIGAAPYDFARWEHGGHPLNLELLFRRLEKVVGADVNVLEWPLVLARVAAFMDEVEEYYERGPGAVRTPSPDGKAHYHNVSVRGFDVADAWDVTPKLCKEEIGRERKIFFEDGVLSLPSAGFYRTALSVLNPSRDPKYDDYSALRWLEHHHHDAEGVDNVILWLGSNNALGTILDLRVDATNDPRLSYSPTLPQPVRAQRFNLWAPADFEHDYGRLLDEVHRIMTMKKRARHDWRVFVGTVPAVTIAPLAKGVGDGLVMKDPFGVLEDGATYFKNYTYLFMEEEDAAAGAPRLTRKEAYTIDSYIAEYNRSIARLVDAKNAESGRERYHVVDVCSALLQAAYKRNNEQPVYDFPDYVRAQYPLIDTRFYHADEQGSLRQGGLFSLDGVHPTVIGQGLLAHEFIKVMNKARPGLKLSVPWPWIYANDDLYLTPVRLMPWLRRKGSRLAGLFLDINRGVSKRPRSIDV